MSCSETGSEEVVEDAAVVTICVGVASGVEMSPFDFVGEMGRLAAVMLEAADLVSTLDGCPTCSAYETPDFSPVSTSAMVDKALTITKFVLERRIWV